MNRTLADFARSCGGTLSGADRAYTGVSTDTRTLKRRRAVRRAARPALQRQRFRRGRAKPPAPRAPWSTRRSSRRCRRSSCADTQAALTDSAAAWRAQFSMPDRRRRRQQRQDHGQGNDRGDPRAQRATTLATRGNLNNHIGVPLTLHRLDADAALAVVEIGANRAGEVAALVSSRGPTVGLITNAGASTSKGSAASKASRAPRAKWSRGSTPAATAVINADDEFAGAVARHGARPRCRPSASRNAADFPRGRHAHRRSAPTGSSRASTLRAPAGTMPRRAAPGGRPQRAERAVRRRGGHAPPARSLDDVRAGLATMRPVPGRLQFKTAPSGAWIVDDSYNANPDSMRAGIEVLASVDARRWLVLGDMGELGDFADASHGEIGRFAREHRIDRLFATGKLSALAVEAFGAGRANGSPTPRRWRARSMPSSRARSACWSRARARAGWSAWSRR